MVNTNFKKRILYLMGVFLAFLLVLYFKIFYLQVIQVFKYSQFSLNQSRQYINVRALRGKILDRNSKVLVHNRPVYSLYITPGYFPKKNTNLYSIIMAYLSKKLKLSTSEIVRSYTITDKYRQNKYSPMLIKRDLDEESYSELMELPAKYMPGVSIQIGYVRKYLYDRALSILLGYTGNINKYEWQLYNRKYKNNVYSPYKNKDSIIGKSGIEKHKDILLRGVDGVNVITADSIGRPIVGTESIIKSQFAGSNITLNIDSDLQRVAYRLMNNKKGVFIVSDYKTGEILVFVSTPSFSANNLVNREHSFTNNFSNKEIADMYNRIMHGNYPPGSTFKILVTIAALFSGVSLDTEYTCKGKVVLGRERREFKCTHVHGKINFVKAFEKSCNVYYYNIVKDIKWDTVYKYADMLGMNNHIKLDIGVTNKGLVPSVNWKKVHRGEPWYAGDNFNHSIGQGNIVVTPLHTHAITSIIANNGKLNKFTLLKNNINNSDSNTYNILTLPKSIIDSMRYLMALVSKSGTARYYSKYSPVPIYGKTGTSERGFNQPDDGWFTCFVPDLNTIDTSKYPSFKASYLRKKPIAITTLYENIPNKKFSSTTAAPLAVAFLRYYYNKEHPCITQSYFYNQDFGCSPEEIKQAILNKRKNIYAHMDEYDLNKEYMYSNADNKNKYITSREVRHFDMPTDISIFNSTYNKFLLNNKNYLNNFIANYSNVLEKIKSSKNKIKKEFKGSHLFKNKALKTNTKSRNLVVLSKKTKKTNVLNNKINSSIKNTINKTIKSNVIINKPSFLTKKNTLNETLKSINKNLNKLSK